MSFRNSSDRETVVHIPISTIATVILMILGIVFAALGFVNASDSRVAPAKITIYLFISAACFAAQFGHGIRHELRWQRVLAVIAIAAALFTVIMGVAYFAVLSQVKMPF